MSLFDVVVHPIGFDPSPNAAFVAMTPKVKPFFVNVTVFGEVKGSFAGVINALRMLRIGEPHDNRQDLIAAFLRPRADDVQSVDVARVDGFDDLSSGPLVLRPDGFDNLRHGIECCVPVRGEKEIEYLPIGAEKGGAILVDEIAIRGNAVRSFLFGEGLRLAGTEAVDGKGGGEGVGRPERGIQDIAWRMC